MELAPEPAKSIRITIRLVIPAALPAALPPQQRAEPAANDSGFNVRHSPAVYILAALALAVVYFLLPLNRDTDVAMLPPTPIKAVEVPPFEKPVPVLAPTLPQTITPVVATKPKSPPSSIENKIPPTKDMRVSRAQLTSGMRGREPTDKLASVITAKSAGKTLYYFTELKNMRGKTVTHNWLREGVLMLSVKFNIESNRWRMFSNSYLRQKAVGRWRVEVVDDDTGKVITHKDFVYKN